MRRVVTGHDEHGRAVVVDDGAPPRSHEFVTYPGFASTVVWATDPGQPVSRDGEDPTEKVTSVVPGPGGTRLLLTTMPPDSMMAAPTFDGANFGAEALAVSPGLAELVEPDGMHTTPTVDYVFIVDGEVCLTLDDGRSTELRAGDIVVQNATRHAWHNRSNKPATFAAVLVGAEPASPA